MVLGCLVVRLPPPIEQRTPPMAEVADIPAWSEALLQVQWVVAPCECPALKRLVCPVAWFVARVTPCDAVAHTGDAQGMLHDRAVEQSKQ